MSKIWNTRICNVKTAATDVSQRKADYMSSRPIERVGFYPMPCDVWGGLRSCSTNIKYSRMCHFKCKKSKIFFPWGPHENVYLGPAVAVDGPDKQCYSKCL